MISIRLTTFVLLTTALVAQDNRFVPADAQLVARVAAPAKWKEQFADTKLAQVLGGQALAPFLAQARKGFDEGLDEARQAGVDAALLDGLWEDYKGDLVIALHIDMEDVTSAIDDDRPPQMAMTITLTPDGSYDLAGLATALARLAEDRANADGKALQDVTIGDLTVRCGGEGGGTSLMLPTLIDEHLVIMFASDIEADGARMLATDNRSNNVGTGKPLYLHVAAERALTTLFDVVRARFEDDPMAPPIDVIKVLTDFGFGCVGALEVSISADGEAAVFETNLRCSAGERGLFGSFILDHDAPKMLRYLPPSAEAFAVQAFDIGAIYKTIKTMWANFDDMVPMAFEDIEEMFAESTKVRLGEDLIDNIGTEVLYLVDPNVEDDMEQDAITAMFSGTCYALSLRDGKAFGEALEKALRSRGLHAARKSEDYQGVKVYRLRIAGALELEYAVTDDMFLLAPGSVATSGAQLRAVLDTRANPEAGLPENVASRSDKVPAGWNGVGVTPLAQLLMEIGAIAQTLPGGDMPPEAMVALDMLGVIGKEMKQVGLDDAIQFTYTSAGGIRSITRF